ncbi:MAG: hypothetical protein KAR57_00075 [Bacteroidales bacterium]|nr:hypothetical protein [Bacteroidales bacterium]
MKKKLLTIGLFVLIAISAQAQKINKYASARIFESQSKELSRMVLVYETGESEIIPLKNWKAFGNALSNNDILIENQKVITEHLNKMSEKGYEVKNMTSTGDPTYLFTFIVFTKKNKNSNQKELNASGQEK